MKAYNIFGKFWHETKKKWLSCWWDINSISGWTIRLSCWLLKSYKNSFLNFTDYKVLKCLLIRFYCKFQQNDNHNSLASLHKITERLTTNITSTTLSRVLQSQSINAIRECNNDYVDIISSKIHQSIWEKNSD